MILSIKLALLSIANIAVAFFFQYYLLIQLGPGQTTDALFAAMAIPQLVLAVISGSLMHVLVPLFSQADDEHARCDAWTITALVAILFSGLTLILYVTAPVWVPLTVPGFSYASKALTVELTRIQLLGLTFTAISGVQWAHYHARQKFIWAEFVPLLASAIALMSLAYALPRFGIVSAAWIASLRALLQVLLLAHGLGKPTRLNLRTVAVAETWRRTKPLLLGTAYYKTDPLIDRVLLSAATPGGMSLYLVAQQIYSAAAQVLNKAIATPFVPTMSRLHGSGDSLSFRSSYKRTLLLTGAVTLTGLAFLILMGQGVLNLVLGHGKVSPENIGQLWWIMIWLGGAFVGGALGQISSSSFYAIGDTVTPTRLGMYSYSVYIPLKIALFYHFHIAGLALAASLFGAANFVWQHHALKSRALARMRE